MKKLTCLKNESVNALQDLLVLDSDRPSLDTELPFFS
jgi:hypothetical protein